MDISFVLQVCSLKIPTEIRSDSYVLTLMTAAIWNFIKNISSGIAESKENVKDLSSRITENFAIDVASLREQIFNDATANFTTPVDRLNQNERKEIMIKLYEQGLFQLKGSIPFVAKRFSCSQATIYRYLGEINT